MLLLFDLRTYRLRLLRCDTYCSRLVSTACQPSSAYVQAYAILSRTPGSGVGSRPAHSSLQATFPAGRLLRRSTRISPSPQSLVRGVTWQATAVSTNWLWTQPKSCVCLLACLLACVCACVLVSFARACVHPSCVVRRGTLTSYTVSRNGRSI